MNCIYIKVRDKLNGGRLLIELNPVHPDHFFYSCSTNLPFHLDGAYYDNFFSVMQNCCWEFVDLQDENKVKQFYSKAF